MWFFKRKKNKVKVVTSQVNLARRDLLSRRVFGGLASVVESQLNSLDTLADAPDALSKPIRQVLLLRPPGAIEETAFLQTCERCHKCADACPHNAISLAPARMREAADTPFLPLDHSACLMCEDRPCISACPSGALTPILRDQPIGTAHLLPHECISRSSFCQTCQEQCPSNAIVFEHGLPVIHAEACTGCGICAWTCPAPQRALAILPLRKRAIPPATEKEVTTPAPAELETE